MKAPSASAPSWCLLIAAALILTSCASFAPRGMGPTPRSESVCDQAPPEPIPPIPDDRSGVDAVFRILIGLYHGEVIKAGIERDCRAAVRRENAAAATGGK